MNAPVIPSPDRSCCADCGAPIRSLDDAEVSCPSNVGWSHRVYQTRIIELRNELRERCIVTRHGHRLLSDVLECQVCRDRMFVRVQVRLRRAQLALPNESRARFHAMIAARMLRLLAITGGRS